jgi:hypothetical protein
MIETWDTGISKAVEADDRERGIGQRLDDVSKSKMKTGAKLKQWGQGVLPTKQQKQAAGIGTLTAGGFYAGKKYKQAKYEGTIPPTMRRAARYAKADVSKARGLGRLLRTGKKGLPRGAKSPAPAHNFRPTSSLGTSNPGTLQPEWARSHGTPGPKSFMDSRTISDAAAKSGRPQERARALQIKSDLSRPRPSYVGKAARRVDPEYDRARRRGQLQGAAIGGAIPLGMVGSKTFQRVGAADMAGQPKTWKGKGIAIRSTPTGRFPKGRAGALGGAALLAGGAAVSQRRGTRERNQQWT